MTRFQKCVDCTSWNLVSRDIKKILIFLKRNRVILWNYTPKWWRWTDGSSDVHNEWNDALLFLLFPPKARAPGPVPITRKCLPQFRGYKPQFPRRIIQQNNTHEERIPPLCRLWRSTQQKRWNWLNEDVLPSWLHIFNSRICRIQWPECKHLVFTSWAGRPPRHLIEICMCHGFLLGKYRKINRSNVTINVVHSDFIRICFLSTITHRLGG